MTNPERVKAIVIGSGFGGSIAAWHLGQAGVQTVVLERGKRWPISPEEDTFCTYRNPDGRAAWLNNETILFEPVPVEKHAGLLERKVGEGITVWTVAAVGGGSVVYNGVLYQPTRENFYRVFSQDIDYDEMDSVYYPRVIERMSASPIPQDILETDYYLSTRVFLEQAKQAGLWTKLLNVAVDWDVVRQEIEGEKKPAAIDGEIWYGINSGVKNSLDKNYLAQAEASGHVEVRPLHIVTEIAENADGGFQVTCTEITVDGAEVAQKVITCDYLFMGAGSIGTSEMLVKARETGKLPKLNSEVGKGWGNNGDSFATRQISVSTNPGQGGPATAVVEHWDNPILPQTFIVFPEWTSPDKTLTTLGMTVAEDRGTFVYNTATGEAILHYPQGSEGAQKVLDAANYTYSLLDKQMGATPPPDQDNSFTGHYHCPINGYPRASTKNHIVENEHANAGITAHPLGGVCMGTACDMFGRVQGYNGLYVVDGALIPGSAAACNPSLTIAAFAERCMDKIIAEDITR
jgi:cholesterol oxidase